MPIASAPSTSRRLLALLSLLQARRDWPARVLAARLEVSERTVRRDVDRLRELDYVVHATRGPDGGYRLGAGTRLPPLVLDDEQAIAIAIALQAAGALGAGLEEAAGRALSTLARTMPTHLARRVESLTVAAVTPSRLKSAETDPETLVHIGRAIRFTEELRFDYAGSDQPVDVTDPRPVRVVEPHHLLLHGGRWYLVGYSNEHEDWRIHRVDRISVRTPNGRRFTVRQVPGGDPGRFLSARFKGSSGDDTWACWGAAVLRAPIAEVAPYVVDGTVEPLDEGRCRVRMGSWSYRSLAATIGRFDADVERVEPPELARAFSELAQRFSAAGDDR